MQQWRENPPASIEFIITDKVGMITFQSVKDEGFICFGNLEIREAAAVGQVKLGSDGLHAQSGQF